MRAAGAGVDRMGLERCNKCLSSCHVRPANSQQLTRPRVPSAQVPLMGDGQPWYRHVLRDPAVPLEALEQISDDIQVRAAGSPALSLPATNPPRQPPVCDLEQVSDDKQVRAAGSPPPLQRFLCLLASSPASHCLVCSVEQSACACSPAVRT